MTNNDAADLAKLNAQEELLVFEEFDEDTALQLGLLIRERADQYGPVIIDIRRGDDLLFFAAMPGTGPANADWARRKRNLVNLLQQSSYALGCRARTGTDFIASMGLNPRDYASHGGCVPIRVRGAGMIGTVTVSGLPQRIDHKLASECIAELLGVELGENSF
jgi:uncharacterized protein (UPF0303 family)